MRKTYEMQVHGMDHTMVEWTIRMMDRLFRRWYNVYGGRRITSEKGLHGEYYVYVEYTANWDCTGLQLSPDFIHLKKAMLRKLDRIDPDETVMVKTWEKKSGPVQPLCYGDPN